MARALDVVHDKIIRAMRQHKAVEDCIASYSGRNPYRKIVHPDSYPTLEITEQPPIELSVIAGEIIYQLRSALDHMFFETVSRHWDGPIPEKTVATLEFPLCINPPGDPLRIPPIPRASFGKKIPECVPDEIFATIEGIQPYNRRHDGHKLLRMLRVFSNIDKHRHVNTTLATINRSHTVRADGGASSTVIMPMLQSGAELYEPVHFVDKSAMEVEDEYVIQIAFDEPEFGPFQTAPIEDVVYNLPTWVFRISTFFNQFLK